VAVVFSNFKQKIKENEEKFVLEVTPRERENSNEEASDVC